MSKNEVTPYFLLAAIGLLLFFTVAFTFSFKEKVLQAFFQKPFLFATEQDNTPEVDLMVGLGNVFKKGMVNVAANQGNISLRWKTTNATACRGRFWSNVAKDDAWTGAKSTGGGDYVLAGGLQTGIYVYSINCSNAMGDSSGANMVLNAGAAQSYLQPQITLFQAAGEGNESYSPGKINLVSKNTKLRITVSSLNMKTAYSICVANGSWPTIYKDIGNFQINESFVLDTPKIYKYAIFCSNENGYDHQEISFMVR